MFRIQVLTPPVTNTHGWLEAGARLNLGPERFLFVVDLQHWSVADYERQWRDGTRRILHGATSTALMTAYSGVDAHSHHMWALWRDEDHLYAQQHSIITDELDAPFDPETPYEHVGERINASRHDLPIREWRVNLIDVYAAAMGIRWPLCSY